MKRYLFILILSLTAHLGEAQNPQGFFLDNWQPKTCISPAYVDEIQPAGTASVVVAVDFSTKIAKVSKGHL